jgi:hypothetical protein
MRMVAMEVGLSRDAEVVENKRLIIDDGKTEENGCCMQLE